MSSSHSSHSWIKTIHFLWISFKNLLLQNCSNCQQGWEILARITLVDFGVDNDHSSLRVSHTRLGSKSRGSIWSGCRFTRLLKFSEGNANYSRNCRKVRTLGGGTARCYYYLSRETLNNLPSSIKCIVCVSWRRIWTGGEGNNRGTNSKYTKVRF